MEEDKSYDIFVIMMCILNKTEDRGVFKFSNKK